MVVTHNWNGGLEGIQRPEVARATVDVFLNVTKLRLGERPGLEENIIREADVADIMEQARKPDGGHLRLGKLHRVGDGLRQIGHPAAMIAISECLCRWRIP